MGIGTHRSRTKRATTRTRRAFTDCVRQVLEQQYVKKDALIVSNQLGESRNIFARHSTEGCHDSDFA